MSTSLQSQKLCFIGAGSMAEAIVRGLIQQEKVFPENILMVNRQDKMRLSALQERYGVKIGHVSHAISNADIVVIAMKPKDVAAALPEIRDFLREDQLIISVVAGLSTGTIEKLLRKSVPIARTMPNTSSTIGLGATGMCFSSSVRDTHKQLSLEIFEAVGLVCTVQENELDMVTGVSGSGPAYIYYLMESMIAAGIEGGLSEEVSRLLTVQTVLGAAHMVNTTMEDPAILRKKVTSAGGTTQAAIETLEQFHFPETIKKAMLRAAERAKEMGAAMDAEAEKK